MDISRRETSLLTGVGALLVLVVILFFGVTVAAQQVAQRRARWQALQQQVAQAEAQAKQRAVMPERQTVEAEAEVAAQLFVTPETVPAVQSWLESVAAESGATVSFMPTVSPGPPAYVLPGFEGCYEVIPLVATVEARYRALGRFLSRVSAGGGPAAVGIRGLTVTPPTAAEGSPRLKARLSLDTFLWIPGAMPKEMPQSRDNRDGSESLAEPSLKTPSLKAPSLPPWGRDPFDARWLGAPRADGLTLNGIVWDARRPTAIVNGTVMEIGDTIEGYRVIAILPTTVLLRLSAEQPDSPPELVLAAS